jgi:hypothetical protein
METQAQLLTVEKAVIRSQFFRFQLLAAAGLSFASLLGCGGQAKTQCAVFAGEYGAKYTLVSGTGECSELKGERIGANTYVTNPQKHNDRIHSMAVKSGTLGDWVANGENETWIDATKEFTVDGEKVLKGTSEKMVKPTLDTNKNDLFYSFGKFKGKFPDGKDICAVPTLNDAHIKLAAIPAHQVRDPDKDDGDDTNGIELIDVEAQDALDVTYKWTNMKVYVTAGITGVLFGADLEYTKNGCTAKYKVTGVAPATDCADENGKPSNAICYHPADQTAPVINSDVKVKCDPELLLCVPDGAFPALK